MKNDKAKAFMRCGAEHHCWAKPEKSKALLTAVALKDPRQCINRYCSRERDACVKDKRCQYTIGHCNDKCRSRTDSRNCWQECLEVAKDKAASDYMYCGDKNHCWDKSNTAVAIKAV